MSESKSDLQKLLCKPLIKFLAAFIIPILFILLIFNRLSLYPYKSLTILTSDLNGQYVSYYSYMKDLLHNGNDIFYTFSKTLGGDMMGLFGYYLLSPLNVVLIFIKTENLPIGIMIISVVKIGLCGLSMYTLLSSKRGCLYRNLLFSTSYAMMAYMIGYLMNLMWLDAVYMLPFVVLGVERIYKNKSVSIYVVTLSYTIISCYYTGYMVCIFVGIYTCYLMIINNAKFKKKMTYFMRFCISSILAVAISTITLLPSILALSGSKESKTTIPTNLTTNFSLSDFIAKFFANSYQTKFVDLPNIYCGLIMLVLVILYFFNRNIKIKEKIASFLVLSVLFFSMYIKQFDMIWHGFAKPNSFPFRYAFVVVFFIILLAERSTQKLTKSFKSIWFFAPLILIGSCAGLLIYTNYMNISKKYIFLDMLIMIAGTYLIYRYKRTDKILAPVVMILIMMLQGVSLYVNNYSCLRLNKYFDNSISGFVKEVKPSIDAVKEEDKGFYRLEKNFYYSINDPMLLSYNGLSHFSSTEKQDVKDFMNRLGYTEGNGFWTYYNMGSTCAADSLFGVKYILSREKLINIYQLVRSTDTVKTYENPYALPMIFTCNDSIASFDEEYKNNPDFSVETEKKYYDKEDKFLLQNSIYKEMTGLDEDIFKPIEQIRKNMENVKEYSENNHFWYTKENDLADGVVHYELEAMSDDPIYMYLRADVTDPVEIIVNGKSLGTYFDVYRHDIVNLGMYTKGNIIDVAIKLSTTQVNYDTPYFYYQDMQVLGQQTKLLQNKEVNVQKYCSSHLGGELEVTKDNQIIMMSIPYDRNWTIKIDGKVVKQKKVLGALMALEVSKGTHKIDMKYVPAGLKKGIEISFVASILFLIYLIYQFGVNKYKKRMRLTLKKEK